MANPRNLREQGELLGPGIDHAAQFAGVHSRNGEIVAWGEAQNAAEAAVGLGEEQTIFLIFQRLGLGQERRKVVFKHISFRVGWHLFAASALVSGAQVAIRIVSDSRSQRKFFGLALPRTLRALRRDEDPLPQQRIEAFVWRGKELLKSHNGFRGHEC